MLEAWHLPGFAGAPEEWLSGRTRAGTAFRSPALSAPDAAGIADAVRHAALEARATRSTEQVIEAVATAGGKLAGEGPEGMAGLELLRVELGWDDGLARTTLEGMARNWTATALRNLVNRELGGAAVLDGFAADDSWTGPGLRRRRAAGPPVLLQVLAGNVPGVAVTATIRALVARSGVLCKLPEGEPGLLPLFARLLDSVDPALGGCIAATWWPGASFPAAWREWAKWAGKAVVYGGDSTIEAVRAGLPAHTELVAYGPRTGVAVILPDAGTGSAELLARDVCDYDQQGCVSPRLVYVVGSAAAPFARRLAGALDDLTRDRPPPSPTESEAVGIREVRAAYEFGGYAGGASGVEAPGDSLVWTVLHAEAPAARTDALPRVVSVHSVGDLDELAGVLLPIAGRIQALGYHGSAQAERLAELGVHLGVSRVAPVGSIAWPPPDWRHEGRHQLLPLLNWTDFETAP